MGDTTSKITSVAGSANDDDWALVRDSAIVLSEGANLLVMPGRQINSSIPPLDGAATHTAGRERIELMPKIAVRVAQSQDRWRQLAQALIAAGAVTARAVDSRNAKALLDAGTVIDAACENYHHEFGTSIKAPPSSVGHVLGV
jgi:hypothetical protein